MYVLVETLKHKILNQTGRVIYPLVPMNQGYAQWSGQQFSTISDSDVIPLTDIVYMNRNGRILRLQVC